jgi:hypothetical protein
MAFRCFFRILFREPFAQSVKRLEQADGAPAGPVASAPEEVRPEQAHASGLFLLSMLQREGRFLDFLQEDVAPFSDSEVGAASRIVHDGCRKVVQQYLQLEPVLKEAEGARVTVPAGFDAQKIRLTGNVAGQAPFQGSLKHHGWLTRTIGLPPVPDSLDLRVLAPAEVEL